MGILKGTLPALLTPYKDDGSINKKNLFAIVNLVFLKA